MYNDYPTANYSSNVDQFIFLKIGGIVLLIAIVVVFLISIMKVYKKANRNPITAIIPFYNIFPLLEICNLPKMYFVFILIPLFNLIYIYKITEILATSFKKDKKFGIGLFLLPIVYYPILGFSKSEYVGINLAGMESKNQVSRIDIIDENKNKEIEVEENVEEDVSTRHIDISLGGGKYQQDYATNLDKVEDDKIITQRNIKEQKKIEEQKKMAQQELLYKPHKLDKADLNIPQEEPKAEPVGEVFDINYIQTVENKKIEEEAKKEQARVEEEERIKEEERQRTEFFKCPKCGTKLPKGTQFCITCGTKIENEI